MQVDAMTFCDAGALHVDAPLHYPSPLLFIFIFFLYFYFEVVSAGMKAKIRNLTLKMTTKNDPKRIPISICLCY